MMEKKIEKIIDRIALGKQKRVTVNKKDFDKVVMGFTKKYYGECTFFFFGDTASIYRSNKEPLKQKQLTNK